MQMMAERGLYKREDLVVATGLSVYQITESKRLLEENELFRTTQVYADYQTCLGSTVELNGFYN